MPSAFAAKKCRTFGTKNIPVDTCWSVPLLAALSTLLITLPATFMPMLFVYFMDDYNISRQSAAWPQNILTMSMHLAGLLVGALQQRCNVVNIAIFGCFLASGALIASAYQINVVGLSLTIGVAYGLGLGSLITSVSIYNLILFDKYKATAVSFTYIAWALTTFFAPTVLSRLRATFAPQGTLLMTGAILLHTVPLCLLLKIPTPVGPTCFKNCFRKCSTRTHPRTFKLSKKSSVALEELSAATLRHPSIVITENMSDAAEKATPIPIQENVQTTNGTVQTPVIYQKALEESDSRATQHTFKDSVAVLLVPAFYVFMVAAVAGDYSMVAMTTTVVDFAVGNGVEMSQAQFLVSFGGVGALLGRIIIMPISDVLPSSRCPLFTGALALTALCTILMTYAKSYGYVVALYIILSTADGFTSSVRNLLVAQYLGVDRMATSTGLYGLLMIPVSLGSPLILGFFRDNSGSYNGFYLMLALANLCAATILAVFLIFGYVSDKRSAMEGRKKNSLPSQTKATARRGHTSALA
ncbi:monocarboxylate transporter 12-like [Haemaphysalis longicornis]